jgi:lactobin A/cerein 7B family class IIb bacteriocin
MPLKNNKYCTNLKNTKMKNQENVNFENIMLVSLNQDELMEHEGGIVPLLGLMFAGLGLGLAASYYVGYAVGSLK